MRWSSKPHPHLGIIVCTIAAIFVILSSAISLHRYWQYDSDYYDFGIFDTALWKVSRFQLPIIDHFVVQNKLIFADHFYPSLFILSSLYWLTTKQEIMFIAQALFVGLSGIFLFRTALIQTKSYVASLAVLISFYGFSGLQNAILFDIHEVTFMVLPISIAIFSVSTDNRRLFWLSFILALGFKESAFVILLGLSTYVFLTKKMWRRTALLSGLVALVYGVIVIKLIIPYFLGGDYFYSDVFNYNWLNPITYFKVFFDSPIKLKSLTDTFFSFGFLPVLAIPLWPAYIFHFLTRFTSNEIRWSLGLHYSAELAPFLSLGCIYLLQKISTQKTKSLIIVFSLWLLTMSIYVYRFKLHGPLMLSTNPVFYRQTSIVSYPEAIISQIPLSASVMAQQNLATHLNHRDTIWILRDNYEDYQPDYIILDNRDGLNPTHYWGITDINSLLDKLNNDPNYKLENKFQSVSLFKKTYNN